MNQQEVVEKIKAYTWERWLERQFSPFMASLFQGGSARESFEKIGIMGVECEAFVYEDYIWYRSQEVFEKMEKQLEIYLENHNMLDITESMTKFRADSLREINALIEDKNIGTEIKLQRVYEILKSVTAYIWLAHGLDFLYDKKLHEIVPKFIKGDIDLYIGDASFPKKKNAYALMEEMILQKSDPKEIVEKFGWLRVRDGFADAFTQEDIGNITVEKQERHFVEIPKELRKIFAEVQELVYFRTQRTDVLCELLFASRPIFKKIGEELGIKFEDLKNYSVQSLISRKPEAINDPVVCVAYKEHAFFLPTALFEKTINEDVLQIKGSIAQRGIAEGAVKIVKNVVDISKVNEGDVLVSQMTVPAFILAMKKAVAFITDEGGITCHAAIMAREMKKPCIIGTRISTQVLHDGDLVEVDANVGMVRIIKKAEDIK